MMKMITLVFLLSLSFTTYAQNLLPVNVDGKYGYLDIKSKKLHIPLKFDGASPFIGARGIVYDGKHDFLINKKGEYISKAYDLISQIKGDESPNDYFKSFVSEKYFLVEDATFCGVIDWHGKEVIPLQYSKANVVTFYKNIAAFYNMKIAKTELLNIDGSKVESIDAAYYQQGYFAVFEKDSFFLANHQFEQISYRKFPRDDYLSSIGVHSIDYLSIRTQKNSDDWEGIEELESSDEWSLVNIRTGKKLLADSINISKIHARNYGFVITETKGGVFTLMNIYKPDAKIEVKDSDIYPLYFAGEYYYSPMKNYMYQGFYNMEGKQLFKENIVPNLVLKNYIVTFTKSSEFVSYHIYNEKLELIGSAQTSALTEPPFFRPIYVYDDLLVIDLPKKTVVFNQEGMYFNSSSLK